MARWQEEITGVQSVAEHSRVVESYLASCVARRDWHGVSDAANDLRELEVLRKVKEDESDRGGVRGD